jgi:hypothetical protein
MYSRGSHVLKEKVLKCFVRKARLSFRALLREDIGFFESLQRFRGMAIEGKREGSLHFGKLLLRKGAYETGLNVLLVLLNEGDPEASKAAAEHFLRIRGKRMLRDPPFSREAFFDRLIQDEDPEIAFNGRCWAALIAIREQNKTEANKWFDGVHDQQNQSQARIQAILDWKPHQQSH